jgi:photosystem II stability/assembly factor-like uncharacterized protein
VRRIDVHLVHQLSETHQYVANLAVDGSRCWAVGGTYYEPTCLYSHDSGHSFVRWETPEVTGLRGIHVQDGTLWVASVEGEIWKTAATDVPSWKTVAVPREAANRCLYSILPDTQRRLWAVGDDGLILRSHGRRFQRVTSQSSHRIFNIHADPSCVWLVDSGGMLQRTTRKGVVEIPLAAMRNKRPLTALVRTVARTLLLIGDGGLILRSTNDGVSWKKVSVRSRVDLEKILVTRYGIYVIGDAGSLLVSHDDGRSFQGLETELQGHLWAIVEIGSNLLIAGERQIWRIEQAQLALELRAAFETRDPVIAALASHVHEGVEGAELVLEDALRERELL